MSILRSNYDVDFFKSMCFYIKRRGGFIYLLITILLLMHLPSKAKASTGTFHSAWDSIMVNFELKDKLHEPLIVLLNYRNDSDYYYLKIQQDQKFLKVTLGQHRNHLNRDVEHFQYDKVLLAGRYTLLLYRAPWVDLEHWKSWKAELKIQNSNDRIFKEAVENVMPMFGAGEVKLVNSLDHEREQHVKIFYKQKEVSKAALKPDLLFGNGMVLQRGKVIPVWGKAKPNSVIKVKLHQNEVKVLADQLGSWIAYLPAMKVATNLNMSISGEDETVLFTDISVGDVWFASGQSNMEMRAWQSDVSKYKETIKSYPNIRFYVQEQWPSEKPTEHTLGTWIKSDNAAIWGVSAVALSFAIALEEHQDIPIGIIQATWGGTGIQSWMPYQSLTKVKKAKPMLDRYDDFSKLLEDGIVPEVEWPYNWEIPGLSNSPTYLYNGMLYPFRNFPIAGFLWYQGESNTYRASQYQYLFPAFIKAIRSTWENTSMPFIGVQLAGYDGKESGNEVENAWPYLRDIQRRILERTKAALMVSAFDLGDVLDIHPYKKWDLGRRMAFAALKLAYRHDNLLYTGPTMNRVSIKDNFAIVKYLKNSINLIGSTGSIEGFELAGEDQVFYPAKATIVSDYKLRLESTKVPIVKAVRYAWENYPIKSNLKNKYGLGAIPFRTDDWLIRDRYPY